MYSSSSLIAGVLFGTILAGSASFASAAQQPVPITNDTPAATAKPMPPETMPVQGTGVAQSTPLTKDQLKSQRKQQKAEEKAATSTAKAAKSNAKAKKQADKAVRDQEKASPSASTSAPAPNSR